MRRRTLFTHSAALALLASATLVACDGENTPAADGAAPDLNVTTDIARQDVTLPADGPSADLLRDTANDGPSPDTTRDGSSADTHSDTQVDSSLQTDTNAGWPLLFTLRTTSVDPHVFDPYAVKSGSVLRWELGDGTTIDANSFDHTYTQAGEKVVRVRSQDGASGITKLYLAQRELAGSIATELGDLANLEVLDLAENQLTGSIPATLGKLGALQRLGLSFNQLTGTIPSELGDLISLQVLSLGTNQLTGSMPSELGQLTSLQQLSLSSCDLTGTIPTTLGALVNLETLNLASNQLGGDIPSQLAGCVSLEMILLRSNQLSGYSPGALSGLTHIRSIDVSDNQLSQTAVDAIIADIYQDRAMHTATVTKLLELGGTNAGPSAAALTQVNELRTSYGWSISCNGC